MKVKSAATHLKLEYSVNKTDKGDVGTAFVVDPLGNKAEVVAPNWFAGPVRGGARGADRGSRGAVRGAAPWGVGSLLAA